MSGIERPVLSEFHALRSLATEHAAELAVSLSPWPEPPLYFPRGMTMFGAHRICQSDVALTSRPVGSCSG